MRRIRSNNINTAEHFDELFSEHFETYNSYKNITHYNTLLHLHLFDSASYGDYGCGNGGALSELKTKYNIPSVYGIDISDEVIKKKMKYETIHFLTTQEYLSSPITLETTVSTHTFEHLDDPKSTVHILLQNTQKLFIIVPYKESWGECPEHVWMFDTQSFSYLKPDLALPGIINEAGYRELCFYWSRSKHFTLTPFALFLAKIRILYNSSYLGILKYIYYSLKYKVSKPTYI